MPGCKRLRTRRLDLRDRARKQTAEGRAPTMLSACHASWRLSKREFLMSLASGGSHRRRPCAHRANISRLPRQRVAPGGRRETAHPRHDGAQDSESRLRQQIERHCNFFSIRRRRISFCQINPFGEAALFDGLVKVVESELIDAAVNRDDYAKLKARVVRKRGGENSCLDSYAMLQQKLPQPRPHRVRTVSKERGQIDDFSLAAHSVLGGLRAVPHRGDAQTPAVYVGIRSFDLAWSGTGTGICERLYRAIQGNRCLSFVAAVHPG